ncbi:hypothetical protein [Ralstonia sp. 24A2]|uniref:hypothetical protein n=1 Tax=Ralstonia sp. 24A2 TaxID=3447364 RepID=UPI003F699213
MTVIEATESADATYQRLLEQVTNPRQRTSLERIKAACDYLEAQKLKVSPSSVEKYCLGRDWDGPKAQSIRNSKNVLMLYLQVRQSKQVLKPSGKKSSEPEIADESLRAYVQLLKDERDNAVAAKKRIEAGLRSLPGISVDALLRGDKVAEARTGTTATPQALKLALSSLLDDSRLANCGLEVAKGRLRHASTKNVLLEKDELDAVVAALSDTSSL